MLIAVKCCYLTEQNKHGKHILEIVWLDFCMHIFCHFPLRRPCSLEPYFDVICINDSSGGRPSHVSDNVAFDVSQE